ncbi:MAG: hypothetical protein WD795_12325 [Woeseia sp.]
MNEETRAATRPAVATNMEDIIGDYGSFFIELAQQLEGVGIDVTGCPVSHLAWRTETFPEYEQDREEIRRFCIADVENVWNGRLTLRSRTTGPSISTDTR